MSKPRSWWQRWSIYRKARKIARVMAVNNGGLRRTLEAKEEALREANWRVRELESRIRILDMDIERQATTILADIGWHAARNAASSQKQAKVEVPRPNGG